MLVASSGNTALQSIMPAIGREIGIRDFYVAIAYTWSAVLWVLLAPYWAEKSDHHGRKTLTMMGISGFVLSMTLCGIALFLRAPSCHRRRGRPLASSLHSARFTAASAAPRIRDPGLPSLQRRGCSRRVAAFSALSSSFGLGTIIGPAVAPLFVVPIIGLAGPLFAFAMIGALVFAAVTFWLPNDQFGHRIGHGAAMSYPSLASTPTGASVGRLDLAPAPQAAELARPAHPPVDRRGSGRRRHPQAATLTCIGFSSSTGCISRPPGSEGPIAIVMMAGAVATLGAQWGLIPRLRLSPRALILWGALIRSGLDWSAGAVGRSLSNHHRIRR